MFRFIEMTTQIDDCIIMNKEIIMNNISFDIFRKLVLRHSRVAMTVRYFHICVLIIDKSSKQQRCGINMQFFSGG